ncbi:hypothetical protein C2E23DRAFT_583692 [Lenzites betulinus]|nr:hypothetical protein C2E23DRAFT_583692 [Lenzites betulinus]
MRSLWGLCGSVEGRLSSSLGIAAVSSTAYAIFRSLLHVQKSASYPSSTSYAGAPPASIRSLSIIHGARSRCLSPQMASLTTRTSRFALTSKTVARDASPCKIAATMTTRQDYRLVKAGALLIPHIRSLATYTVI